MQRDVKPAFMAPLLIWIVRLAFAILLQGTSDYGVADCRPVPTQATMKQELRRRKKSGCRQTERT